MTRRSATTLVRPERKDKAEKLCRSRFLALPCGQIEKHDGFEYEVQVDRTADTNEIYMKRHRDDDTESNAATKVSKCRDKQRYAKVVQREIEQKEDGKGRESMDARGTSSSNDTSAAGDGHAIAVSERPDDIEKEHENKDTKAVPNVKGPSPKEMEEHERTHNPYRNWCKHCVRGRARENSHNQKANKDGGAADSHALLFHGKR